jgi:hypothetical protein
VCRELLKLKDGGTQWFGYTLKPLEYKPEYILVIMWFFLPPVLVYIRRQCLKLEVVALYLDGLTGGALIA